MASFKDVLKHIAGTTLEGAYGDQWRQAEKEREAIESVKAARALDQSRFEETSRSNRVREGQADRGLDQRDTEFGFKQSESERDQGNIERRFGLSEEQLAATIAAQRAAQAYRDASLAQGSERLGIMRDEQAAAAKEREDRLDAARQSTIVKSITDLMKERIRMSGGDEDKMAALTNEALQIIRSEAAGQNPEAIAILQQEKQEPGFLSKLFSGIGSGISNMAVDFGS